MLHLQVPNVELSTGKRPSEHAGVELFSRLTNRALHQYRILLLAEQMFRKVSN
jgi:hypothetical protein